MCVDVCMFACVFMHAYLYGVGMTMCGVGMPVCICIFTCVGVGTVGC